MSKFKILQEGTVTIRPNGQIWVQGFHIKGTLADLRRVVIKRVLRAAKRVA